ncbi:hypothetical protein TUBRATIS_009340 [Tubulinosema ratisbonensis]|uniref:Uncharacterized protein n=1 Tax=Tubulinosema ratisbonensis TaxID=291195 RepID=A0A437AN81_9MICR|nr:hypothetical protein TUBRATIS_009340 [Tubulinosema ratisbonensis]
MDDSNKNRELKIKLLLRSKNKKPSSFEKLNTRCTSVLMSASDFVINRLRELGLFSKAKNNKKKSPSQTKDQCSDIVLGKNVRILILLITALPILACLSIRYCVKFNEKIPIIIDFEIFLFLFIRSILFLYDILDLIQFLNLLMLAREFIYVLSFYFTKRIYIYNPMPFLILLISNLTILVNLCLPRRNLKIVKKFLFTLFVMTLSLLCYIDCKLYMIVYSLSMVQNILANLYLTNLIKTNIISLMVCYVLIWYGSY